MSTNRRRTVALVAALMLVTAVAFPAVAAAETSLSVTVDQDHETGDALVTVTDNDTAVENATVTVSTDENVSYDALNETYETDENGTVVLPNPNETIDVTLSVEYDNTTETENVTLIPLSDSLDVTVDQADGEDAVVNVTQYGDTVENATVNVTTDENVTYAALDETYETDENGTTVLPAPSNDLNVTVTATSGDLVAETEASLTAPDLSVTATQNDAGELTVEVTKNNDSLENATVEVSTDENATYEALNKTYQTNENGTAVLPAPSEDLNVTVTATAGDLSAETDVSLVAPDLTVSAMQNDAGELYVEVTKGTDYVENATVVVESDDGDYAYDDTYTATDGTLTLPAPTENVTVTVTASDGDETATTNATLSVQTDDNANNDFAEALVTFIEHMKSQDYEGPLGQQVSEFVHANNPASEKANGPPEHAGPNGDDAGDKDEAGDNAADDNDRRGPPEHAGANGDLDQTRDEDHDRDTENETETTDADDVTGDEDEEEEEVEDDEAEDDDDETESERGPPAHANNA